MCIDKHDSSIFHSLRSYWATNPQADLTDVVFQVASLLSIQNGSGYTPPVGQKPSNSGKPYYRKSWNKRRTANNINLDTTGSPTRSSRRRSKSPPVMDIQPPSMPSTLRYQQRAPHHRFSLLAQLSVTCVTTPAISLRDARSWASIFSTPGDHTLDQQPKVSGQPPTGIPESSAEQSKNRFRGRGHSCSSSSVQQTLVFQT